MLATQGFGYQGGLPAQGYGERARGTTQATGRFSAMVTGALDAEVTGGRDAVPTGGFDAEVQDAR